MSRGAPGVRYAEVERETTETRIQLVLDLDGGTKQDVSTGVGFLDHMLKLMAFHGHLDVGIHAEGDLHVDDHHVVEDVGICFGKAVREALRGEHAVARYASNHTPMDEALVLIAVDLSGRGELFWNVPFRREKLGDLSTENIKEFFRAVALHGGITLHIHWVTGSNDHHIAEAIFKGFGRAIYAATHVVDRRVVPSTKGQID